MKILFTIFIAAILTGIGTSGSQAQQEETCAHDAVDCRLTEVENTIAEIESDRWRDSAYREIAKLHAAHQSYDQALAVIDRITSPDTQALTLRGIAMEIAANEERQETQDALFKRLHKRAEQINHPPSYHIALSYIAMGQAYADDLEGALATSTMIDNVSLRNKAYGETAEIMALEGDIEAIQQSLSLIVDDAFAAKSGRLISRILLENGFDEEAYEIALNIKDSYQKSQALLFLLAQELTPGEVNIE